MDYLTLVAFGSALVSVGCAVFSVWFVRRGGDSGLQADVEELALLVERMGKAQRRERMARVREGSGAVVVAPGGSQEATQTPLDFPDDPKARKLELRRRMMRSKLQ